MPLCRHLTSWHLVLAWCYESIYMYVCVVFNSNQGRFPGCKQTPTCLPSPNRLSLEIERLFLSLYMQKLPTIACSTVLTWARHHDTSKMKVIRQTFFKGECQLLLLFYLSVCSLGTLLRIWRALSSLKNKPWWSHSNSQLVYDTMSVLKTKDVAEKVSHFHFLN